MIRGAGKTREQKPGSLQSKQKPVASSKHNFDAAKPRGTQVSRITSTKPSNHLGDKKAKEGREARGMYRKLQKPVADRQPKLDAEESRSTRTFPPATSHHYAKDGTNQQARDEKENPESPSSSSKCALGDSESVAMATTTHTTTTTSCTDPRGMQEPSSPLYAIDGFTSTDSESNGPHRLCFILCAKGPR